MASQAAGAPQGTAKETETKGALRGPGPGGIWGGWDLHWLLEPLDA